MTKHKPATPLPWCISNPDGDNDTQVIQMRYANPSAVCMGSREDDADYIVHAANAYPRLVEALARIAKYDAAASRIDEARALLRELGEDL